MLRYSNTGETVGSSILTTKDVTKITEKIFFDVIKFEFVDEILRGNTFILLYRTQPYCTEPYRTKTYLSVLKRASVIET